jgi:predicted CopG family antitoxin
MEEDIATRTIPVRISVYEQLVFLKSEGDTFSDVIERLLDKCRVS